jgi:hypothetical protein
VKGEEPALTDHRLPHPPVVRVLFWRVIRNFKAGVPNFREVPDYKPKQVKIYKSELLLSIQTLFMVLLLANFRCLSADNPIALDR